MFFFNLSVERTLELFFYFPSGVTVGSLLLKIFFSKIFSSLGNINKFLFLSLIEKIATLGITQVNLI